MHNVAGGKTHFFFAQQLHNHLLLTVTTPTLYNNNTKNYSLELVTQIQQLQIFRGYACVEIVFPGAPFRSYIRF